MTERQKHGFEFEGRTCEAFDGMSRSSGYTDRYDGTFSSEEGTERHLSVKTRGMRSELCLGDFSRIAGDDEPEVLIEGLHERDREISHVNAYRLDDGMSVFLGDNARDLKGKIKGFSEYMMGTDGFNSYDYDREWTRHRREFQSEYKEALEGDLACIAPRPKRDHKSQRRLQCAISRSKMDKVVSQFKVCEADLDGCTVTDIVTGETFSFDDADECMRKVAEISRRG